MKLLVTVTQEHINKALGYEGEFDKDPIAHALKEEHQCSEIDVDEDRILVTTPEGQRLRFKTPRLANHFIGDFDDGRRVKPLIFELADPEVFPSGYTDREPLI